MAPFGLADMFEWRSRAGTIGPSFQWNLFNYGQITNQVRFQDARFQELIIFYQNTVLQAQREVEDALIAFLKAQQRAQKLAAATVAAKKSVDLAMLQYSEGHHRFHHRFDRRAKPLDLPGQSRQYPGRHLQ